MARRLSRDDIISNVYYNLETGFGSTMRPFRKPRNKTRPSTGWMWKTL